MIPKIIHYCWFGNSKTKPPKVLNNIKMWSHLCPDYEIIEWNEDNFNIYDCPYLAEAYKHKKWAFVSDCVRMVVLEKYGGIYFDTDVKLIKTLDSLLIHKVFLGMEKEDTIMTAVIGIEKNHVITKKMVEYYRNINFISDDGNLILTPNVVIFTKIVKELYFLNELSEEKFISTGDLNIYPSRFFSPKNFVTGKVVISEDTYTIHDFEASWLTKKQKINNFVGHVICQLFGEKVLNFILESRNRNK